MNTRPQIAIAETNPAWLPYFGHQARYSKFVLEAAALINPSGKSLRWGETNAGVYGIALPMAQAGHTIVANDIGGYSEVVGKALLLNCSELEAAALAAASFDPIKFELIEPTDEGIAHWRKWLTDRAVITEGSPHTVVRKTWRQFLEDLEDDSLDALYVDFAWPWRDGQSAEEFTLTAQGMDRIVGREPIECAMPNGLTIWQDVKDAITQGLRKAPIVILSNQSSNYPSYDALRCFVEGFAPLIMERRLDVPATAIDNLNRWSWFGHQQLIFAR